MLGSCFAHVQLLCLATFSAKHDLGGCRILGRKLAHFQLHKNSIVVSVLVQGSPFWDNHFLFVYVIPLQAKREGMAQTAETGRTNK